MKSEAEREFDAWVKRRRRGVMNLAELAVALLHELAHEWNLTPRRIIRPRGVRWVAGDAPVPSKSGTWTRVYEDKGVRVGAGNIYL
jgi:hypothetical protein